MICTPEDLADMLKMPRRSVIESVTKQPGFPQSITGSRKPRWLMEEILKWMKRKSAHSSHKGSFR